LKYIYVELAIRAEILGIKLGNGETLRWE